MGVAGGWPARMESGNEEGQVRVPACCGDQRSRAEGGAGTSSSGEDP